MARKIKLYFATLLVFLAIDMVWLGIIANSFYREQIGYLFSPSTNWIAAGLFYLLFILGILIFVVLPGLERDSLKWTLRHAALFGLITYATYDLTNLATIRGWPVLLTLVDLIWGTILTLGVSTISYWIGSRLQPKNMG